MGMPSTGALTIYEALRLDLRLIKNLGLLKPGEIKTGNLAWSSRGEQTAGMTVICYHRVKDESSLILVYQTVKPGQDPVSHTQKIDMVEVDSNLGTGKVLFFVCPVSGKLCRNLYQTNRSGKFQHRECYTEAGRRLYYDCQIASHIWRYRDVSHNTEKKMEEMRPFRSEYAGRETRSNKRYRFLNNKRIAAEQEMWMGRGMPLAIKQMVGRTYKK